MKLTGVTLYEKLYKKIILLFTKALNKLLWFFFLSQFKDFKELSYFEHTLTAIPRSCGKILLYSCKTTNLL